jgi:capsule polysaccharide export protein KpsE/RkpR
MEKARKELSSNTEIEIQDEGDLTISAYDTDPRRAADMANYYVELLNDINSDLRVQNARGNRLFVEQRYRKNLEDIRRAEDSLNAFQMKYGVIAMPEQTVAAIKAGGEVYAKLAAKEIDLGVLRRTLGEDHPSVQAGKIEIEEIKKKIKEMNSGSKLSAGEMQILVPFRQTPDLGMRYIRLYREVEIQYKILQFITPMFEQAKVEEQRSTPSVIVLDHALPAERKAKPKVSLFAFLALVISTAVSLVIVFSIVGIQRLRAIDPARFDSLLAAARTDWFGLKRLPWKRHRGM